MNYKDHFTNIKDILRPYADIWQREVIDVHRAQEIDSLYKDAWLLDLEELSEEQLYKVDCLRDYSVLAQGELRTILESFKALEVIAKIDPALIQGVDSLPSWAFNKVKGKKQYEILTIANFLTKLQKNEEFGHVVDIGGGVGHLSRILAHYFNMDMVTLDINKEFQEIGKKRIKKYPHPEKAKEVKFINHDFTLELDGELNKKIFSNNSFSLGLHTCGGLAVKHMDVVSTTQTRGLLNFGCCYNKLAPQTEINVSNFAKESPLIFDRNACTLATRGHQSMTLEDFRQKIKVKDYRYCLQFYIDSIYGRDIEVSPIGDAHKRLYLGSFSKYAISKCEENSIPINLNENEFEELLNENKALLRKLYLCDVIRWQFGRLLELYILLDRVIMLQERGKNASIYEFFDEKLSPRNIGIYYHDQ